MACSAKAKDAAVACFDGGMNIPMQRVNISPKQLNNKSSSWSKLNKLKSTMCKEDKMFPVTIEFHSFISQTMNGILKIQEPQFPNSIPNQF